MIITSVFRLSGWRALPAATLAQAIVQPVAMKTMGLMDLFTGAQVAGATVTEFRAVWQYSEFVRRVEDALQDGNLAGAAGLLAVCPVDFSAETLQALQAVLTANTLRAIDIVALEQLEQSSIAPETVSAQDVTDALEAAGYIWDGDEWVRG